MHKNERIVSLDFVRIFSCICIIVVHFNAAVSGYNGAFLYPNSITPNFFLEGRLYLGDIGVSLFFILSGASQMITYKSGNLLGYYKKKFLSLYPMFWIAYIFAFSFDFLYWKGMSTANVKLVLFSVLGMDGYLGSLGLFAMDFYKVGDWFLGCIILIFLLFPILHSCVEKKPILTLLVTLGFYALYLLAVQFGDVYYHNILFFLRIPEIIIGMLFTKFEIRKKPRLMLGIAGTTAWLAVVVRKIINPLTLNIAVCMFLFSVLVWIGENIHNKDLKSLLQMLSALTYPIFLVHHWLISKLIMGFDLVNIPKYSVYVLFLVYLLLTFLSAYKLNHITKKMLHYMIPSSKTTKAH